jgi:Domain of unknown function (DUF4136)
MNQKLLLGRFVIFALAAEIVAGCESTPKVHYNVDPSANLSSYRTYAFAVQPGTNRSGNSTLLTSYFETAIAREMDARGYQQSESNPDLLVNFNASTREDFEVRSTPAYGYYGYRRGLYSGSYVETVRYKVGTANVEVADAGQRKILWEGVAEGRLTDAAMKNPEVAVDNAVTQIFVQFPGHAAH